MDGADASAGRFRALLVPADHRSPVAIRTITDAAAAISDAIGGGLLDEVIQGVHQGQAYCVYGDEDREVRRMPDNLRAGRLAARLGWPPGHHGGLRGDLLIVGAPAPLQDGDIPPAVLREAVAAGLLPPPPTR